MAVEPLRSSPRRRFLTWSWIGLFALAVAEAMWVLISFLRPRRREIRQSNAGEVVIAGPLERFERNTVTAFPEGRFYLVRLESGGFLALHRECTHLGCTVSATADEQNRVLCPCHVSYFDLQTGQPNDGSPAKTPLPHLGWVLLDGAGKTLCSQGPDGVRYGKATAAQLATARVFIAKKYEEVSS